MLGELIYESKGKIIGQRILSVENGIPKMEITISGDGKYNGVEITESFTYWAVQRDDGSSYGQGQGVIMTKDGDGIATAIGRGEGKRTDSGKMKYKSAIFFESSSKNKLASLNRMLGVSDYEVDESGNYTHRIWEWK